MTRLGLTLLLNKLYNIDLHIAIYVVRHELLSPIDINSESRTHVFWCNRQPRVFE